MRRVQHPRRQLTVKFAVFLVLLVMVSVLARPANAQVAAAATTAGFGAAFGYAQTIGPISYTQAGSIGNGAAVAAARTHWTSSLSAVISTGNAAVMASAIGTPFGSTASVQAVSFFGGFAQGAALAYP